jgi:hypothetical protein
MQHTISYACTHAFFMAAARPKRLTVFKYCSHWVDPTEPLTAAVIAPEELVTQPGTRVAVTLPQPNR